ncbi:hypothetical protein SAMN05428984_3523 [Sphingomonas sp. OK281]|nr:hypothetical protein SAMN05428984_3523 [Sphingomonas sp. OK281]
MLQSLVPDSAKFDAGESVVGKDRGYDRVEGAEWCIHHRNGTVPVV